MAFFTFYQKETEQTLRDQIQRLSERNEELITQRNQNNFDLKCSEREVTQLQGDNKRLSVQLEGLRSSLVIAEQDMLKAQQNLAARDLAITELKHKITKDAYGYAESLETDNEKLRIESATYKAKVEMQEKALDVAGEIIDIKELVAKLIDKVPEFKVSEMHVNVETKKK